VSGAHSSSSVAWGARTGVCMKGRVLCVCVCGVCGVCVCVCVWLYVCMYVCVSGAPSSSSVAWGVRTGV
jgi:hypothetical protein